MATEVTKTHSKIFLGTRENARKIGKLQKVLMNILTSVYNRKISIKGKFKVNVA